MGPSSFVTEGAERTTEELPQIASLDATQPQCEQQGGEHPQCDGRERQTHNVKGRAVNH